jgi:hypothetical protein
MPKKKEMNKYEIDDVVWIITSYGIEEIEILGIRTFEHKWSHIKGIKIEYGYEDYDLGCCNNLCFVRSEYVYSTKEEAKAAAKKIFGIE